MSHIVDAVVFLTLDERVAMEALNSRLAAEDECRQVFSRISTDEAGGSKVFCGEIWAGAFNYVISSRIEKAFAESPWRWPERAVLIVDPYDADDDPRPSTASQLRKEMRITGGER